MEYLPVQQSHVEWNLCLFNGPVFNALPTPVIETLSTVAVAAAAATALRLITSSQCFPSYFHINPFPTHC